MSTRKNNVGKTSIPFNPVSAVNHSNDNDDSATCPPPTLGRLPRKRHDALRRNTVIVTWDFSQQDSGGLTTQPDALLKYRTDTIAWSDSKYVQILHLTNRKDEMLHFRQNDLDSQTITIKRVILKNQKNRCLGSRWTQFEQRVAPLLIFLDKLID